MLGQSTKEEVVPREGSAREVRPGDLAVKDRLGDALAEDRVDPGCLADEHHPPAPDPQVEREPARGEALHVADDLRALKPPSRLAKRSPTSTCGPWLTKALCSSRSS